MPAQRAHAVGFLTISTGIGAGVVHGGRLLRGPRSLAEVGHVVIDWRAWVDGGPSTLEELGSGSGVARLAGEAGLGDLGAREVQAARGGGGARGRSRIWQQAIAACAAGVSSLVMSFYPSTVVIGGGLGRQDEFFGPLREMVLRRPGHQPSDLTIVRSTLGDDAGLSGAGRLGGSDLFALTPTAPRRPNDRSQEMPSTDRADLGMVLELETKLQYNPSHTGRTQEAGGSLKGAIQDQRRQCAFQQGRHARGALPRVVGDAGQCRGRRGFGLCSRKRTLRYFDQFVHQQLQLS